jgi:hypothetical protein
MLKLYREIKILHRKLPSEIRYLGDQYVSEEFRRHKNCDPKFIPAFEKAWIEYRDSLNHQLLNNELKGQKLEDKMDDLSDEQVSQLYELKKTARDVK